MAWEKRLLFWTVLVPLALFVGLGAAVRYELPDERGQWTLPGVAGRPPQAPVELEIRGVGRFVVNPEGLKTRRPDIFRPGFLSVFDLVAHLADLGLIDLIYHYDPTMMTHVIESLNGLRGWWYDAHYAGGRFERTAVRMDHYPVKDGMRIVLYLEDPKRLAAIHQSFREEVDRLAQNEGRVVIPEVVIWGPRGTLAFREVPVRAHGVRAEMLQPGVITALDVLLSLGELGLLTKLGLVWHDQPLDCYKVELIAGEGFDLEAGEGCTILQEVGSAILAPFPPAKVHTDVHVHLSPDLQVLVAPEYVRWRLVCP